MADVLTTKHKSDIVRAFYDDLQNNDYYVIVSSLVRGETEREPVVNSQYSKTRVLENVMFGKKILPSDIKFMIKYHPWQKDTVYDQYDDTLDLEELKFYAVVGPTNNNSGDYRVYKCLSNNNFSPSIDAPNYEASRADQIYQTTDGYVWKFMYVLTEAQFEAYNSNGYIPLVGNFDINPPEPSGSELSDIFVENYLDNVGYPNVQVGSLSGAPQARGGLVLRSNELSEVADYYAGMTIYITNNVTNTESFQYVIDSYFYDASVGLGKMVVIGDPQGDGVELNALFRILPTIKISGNGTGASAVAEMVESRINSILITNAGTGYNKVEAEVIRPNYDFDPEDPYLIDTEATLRPVLSPPGGHNYNLIDEMHCRHVGLYGYITESQSNSIGQSGSYSSIAIVKNPSFKEEYLLANSNTSPEVFDNRIYITTDDYEKATLDTLLIQKDSSDQKTFEAYVHEVDPSSNTVYLSNYMGAYFNVSNSDISLDINNNLYNEVGQIIQINTPVANNVIESPYTQRTGTIYYMEDFFPITRTSASREEYKLVLEF